MSEPRDNARVITESSFICWGHVITGLQELSRAIGVVSEAATKPLAWPGVMAELTKCLDATAVTLVRGRGPERAVVASTLTVEATAPYVERFRERDFVLNACECHPAGIVHSGWPLVDDNTNTEFYQEWQRRFEVTDGLAVRLSTTAADTFVVSSTRRDEPFATAQRKQFVDALVPHLERALYFGDLCGDEKSLALTPEMGFGAADIRHGLVLVDARARVVAMNAAAQRIGRRGDGITFRSGIIAPTDVVGAQRLITAIDRATSATGPRWGGQALCRRSGMRPYVLHVNPIVDTDAGRAAVHASVVIVDPEEQPLPPGDLLHVMFDLTRAEVGVALRVLQGETIGEIAIALTLSVATVKTHLQHIFRKTGTARQTDLIRLLLAIQP